MQKIARIVHQHDAALREALQSGRSGLFKRKDGDIYVLGQVPLGGRHTDETIMIFADENDLELFYQSYLKDGSE